MRPSRRQPDELRAVSLERGVVKYAEGSCFVKFGDTHVLVTATLEDRLPPWLKGQARGWVTAEYGTMTGKAIGAHAHMHKTKVSRAVAFLEKRKLLARRANRADMREAFLSLTPAGRAIYQDLAPVAAAFADRFVEAIDPSDRDAFDRALKALAERAKKLTM